MSPRVVATDPSDLNGYFDYEHARRSLPELTPHKWAAHREVQRRADYVDALRLERGYAAQRGNEARVADIDNELERVAPKAEVTAKPRRSRKATA